MIAENPFRGSRSGISQCKAIMRIAEAEGISFARYFFRPTFLRNPIDGHIGFDMFCGMKNGVQSGTTGIEQP